MTRQLMAVGMVLALLVAGCGGSGDREAEQDSRAMPPASVLSTRLTPSPTATPTQGKARRNVVAWILQLGPGAPEEPPEFTAYRLLQEQRCGDVFARVNELDEPARTLYAGAAHGCLAAFSRKRGDWPKAAKALTFVSARLDELTCMDRAAYLLLERLVAARAANPAATFTHAPFHESAAPPCPVIDRLSPNRGVEGDVVRIIGTDLVGNVIGVEVIDSLGNVHSETDLRRVPGGLEFTLPAEPPPEASATVCIALRAEPDWTADAALFTYGSGDTGPTSTMDCPPQHES